VTKFETKVIRDSNLDFWINLDPHVCRICSEMLWMHYRVGVSHFTKYCTNRPLTVQEMLTNVQKSPILQWWRKWKSDPESTSKSGSPPKVNHFLTVTPCLCLPSLVDVHFFVRQLSCLHNDRTITFFAPRFILSKIPRRVIHNKLWQNLPMTEAMWMSD